MFDASAASDSAVLVWEEITMKKGFNIILAGLFALSLAAGFVPQQTVTAASEKAQAESEPLSVYASFYPIYDFASKIGGDKVTVINLVPAGMEPHDWEPTASDIIGLENADILVYNGAGMEHWVADVLASLQNKDLIAVEASEGVTLLEGHHEGEEEHEEDEEEHEAEGFDPHVWLSPLNAKKEAENIKNAFVTADPGNKDYYESNYEKVAAEFDALDQEFAETLAALPNKDIIVAHEAFGYLAAAYDLHQVGIEGLAPDSEPDPARMAEIIDFAKANNVKTIFFEELVSPKVAETVANAIGATTAVLSPIEGLSDEQIAAGDDYFSVMRKYLDALIEA